MSEIWLPVPGYEGLYELSSLGRLRSLYFNPPRINRLSRKLDGYPVAMLSKNGKRRPHTMHRLVCRAFHGEQPNPLHKEVCHLDGNLDNCRASNLKWAGRVENESHKLLHGTRRRGEQAPHSILTEAAVREIRAKPGNRQELATRFGCTVHAIDSVRKGRSWRHVA